MIISRLLTSKAWLSLLETSFVIFLLPPFYANISKHLINLKYYSEKITHDQKFILYQGTEKPETGNIKIKHWTELAKTYLN